MYLFCSKVFKFTDCSDHVSAEPSLAICSVRVYVLPLKSSTYSRPV